VDVGFGDVGDAQVLPRGGVDVSLHVAIGIDHDRLAGGAAADQIAVLRDEGLKYPLDDHALIISEPASLLRRT
jgi:hypothetical protein